VFVGTATFVSDARPDVEALFPTAPLNYRGGWGYLLLTWGLANQGNGTYTLHPIAFDADGNAVSIDSGPLQSVAYGDSRVDVGGLFSGFTNTAAAGGHYTLDTTGLSNGVHTISWLVTDDCNRADGIGSRFFTVQNTVVTAPAVMAARSSVSSAMLDGGDPILVSYGFGELGVVVEPDASGLRVATLKQGERIELRLPRGYDEAWQVVLGERRALPTGASWDPSSHTFAWQPAPAFLGEYEFVFVRDGKTIRVRIVVS
jgi:hypothetical protein